MDTAREFNEVAGCIGPHWAVEVTSGELTSDRLLLSLAAPREPCDHQSLLISERL
jgi:hypothetical protein